MEQLAWEASVAAQELASTEKGAAGEETERPVTAAEPMLVTLTVCAAEAMLSTWLPKLIVVALNCGSGPAGMPVPVSETVLGLFGALPGMTSCAESVPAARGVNVTL